MGDFCTRAKIHTIPKIFNNITATVEIANYEVFIPKIFNTRTVKVEIANYEVFIPKIFNTRTAKVEIIK